MMMEWLSDTLVMTTLLMLFVLIIRKPVAAHFGPSVAYWLWLLPAARLFMPSLEKTIQLPAPSDVAAAPAAEAAPLLLEAQNAAMSSPLASGINWLGLALTLWLGGAALLFVIQMIRYSDMRDELLSDADNLGEVGGIRLISSDRVSGPLAFGLLHRFIVVPDTFTSHFDKDESALAIEHELSHHKSGDLFVNLIAFTVLCLNWFNPVAWMAWHAFRLDQEAACDARVLSGKDAECRHAYGRTLARASQDGLPTFATALNSPKTIIERLRRLAMNNDSSKRRIVGRIGIFGVIAVALPLTATVVPVWANEEKAASEAKHEKTIKKQARKEVRIYKSDGDMDGDVDVIDGDDENLITRKIEKDGKRIIVKSNKEISDEEIEKLMKEAEGARREAIEARSEAGAAGDEAREIRIEIEKQTEEGTERRVIIKRKRGLKDSKKGAFYVAPPVPPVPPARPRRVVHPEAISALSVTVPDIQISEIKGKCNRGKQQHVSTSVSNNNGKRKMSVRVALCGKAEVAEARTHALTSLRAAKEGLAIDENIPAKMRQNVLEKIEHNIRRLERDIEAGDRIA